MGQKVNPYGLRLGIINDWRTRWYSEKEYSQYLSEDIKIRRYLTNKLYHAGISKIDIERTEQHVKIVIYAGRPGIVIGKKGSEVDRLRSDLEKMTGKKIRIDIQEVRSPEINAVLIAQNVAQQLESRVSFRRAMKKAVSQARQAGVKGVRIASAGRLGGAEMARTEWYREGRVPLHTLRADIDYGVAEANTKSGKIGVKVWVYLGDVPLKGKAIRREFSMESADELEAARPIVRPKVKVKEQGAKEVKKVEEVKDIKEVKEVKEERKTEKGKGKEEVQEKAKEEVRAEAKEEKKAKPAEKVKAAEDKKEKKPSKKEEVKTEKEKPKAKPSEKKKAATKVKTETKTETKPKKETKTTAKKKEA